MDLPDAPGRHRIRSPSAESAKPVLDLVQEAIIILDKEPEIARESGPSLPDPPDRRRIRLPSAESAKSMLDLVRGGAIILGLALYGAARLAEETFYGALGTTPDEVGLSYLATVTRAAIGVVSAGTLILIYLLLSMGWFLLSKYLWRHRGEERRRPPMPPVPAWKAHGGLILFALLWLGLAGLVFYISWWNEETYGLGAAALIPAAAGLALLFIAPLSRLSRFVAAFLMLVSLVGIGSAASFVGTWKADDVKSGMGVGTDPLFGVVPFSAYCVDIVKPDQTTSGEANPGQEKPEGAWRYMYLGEAESTVILYRVAAADYKDSTKDGTAGIPGTVRIPSGEAAFEPRVCL
jgi:hypothetical protein